MMDVTPELSVVIIARNEAGNIARTIEAVLHGVVHYPGTEILLVDSASTDKTVEIARLYPINIVRLKPDWYLSASAGRYIGTCRTRGKYILYLDGDMELDPDWLCDAISYAAENPQTAVIGGYLRNVYLKKGLIIGEEDELRDPQNRILEVQFIGGAMLCRRSAVIACGGFHPFISGDEEVDFCMRIRQAAYKVVRLPRRICRHYCVPLTSSTGILRRLRLNMWFGYGQVARHYLGGTLFWPYIRARGSFLIPLAGLLLTFTALALSLGLSNGLIFGGWVFLCVTLLAGISIKKGSIKATLISVLIRLLIAYGTIRGFLMVPHSWEEYPTDPEIVQVAY